MISNLCALQFVTTNDYQANLDKLISLIESSPKDSVIVAPELNLQKNLSKLFAHYLPTKL